MINTPLDLYGEVTAADGSTYKWDANQVSGSRPLNLSFRTKIGEGFSDASLHLPRRIDRDYPDLELLNNVTLTGADGTVAYEGRISAMPRELNDRHSIIVTAAGWMAHAKDKRFVMPIVDRDPSHWGQMPIERRQLLTAGGTSVADFSYSTEQGGIVCALPNQALGALTIAEAWYQAPAGASIATVGYRGTASVPAGWVQGFYSGNPARNGSGASVTTTTLDGATRTAAMNPDSRYVFHLTYSNGTAATPASGAAVQISKIAAYGNHTIPLQTSPDPDEPPGVYASDALAWIAQTHCPMLDISGIQATSYVIQHLDFSQPTFPYDAFLEINKFHLWSLGVWENKRLDYRPYDLTDYDWEIRTDDPGTTFSPQGPSTESLFNGICVTYTDPLTGTTDRLTPNDDANLMDSSASNPWNKHGIDAWDEISLSSPAIRDSALNLGKGALADRNRPRTPGTITVSGYIRDRAGNRQPVWKVRAGDTISITNFPNDEPRLIVETDYNDNDKSIRIAVDRPFALLDAYLDRVGNALGARGLI